MGPAEEMFGGGHIIMRAEQALKLGGRANEAFRSAPAKHAGEKLGRIAEIFQGDSRLVALFVWKRGQPPTALEHALIEPVERGAGEDIERIGEPRQIFR